MQNYLLAHSNTVLLLLATLIGLAAALVGWLATRAMASVPREDRTYKDPPPLGFRLLWWPIHALAYFIDPLMPDKSHREAQTKLRKAGLDFSLSPSQFLAARLVAAVLVALLCCWILGSFDRPGALAYNAGMGAYLWAICVGTLCGYGYPAVWLRDRLVLRRSELLKSLPFYLDIITLCVEAGLNLQGALSQAVSGGPKGVLRDEIQRVLRDIRAGKSRADALRGMAERLNEPGVSTFTGTVIQAESMGMNLGPVLRAQADQRRSERFLRAEKLAMEAPVKLLFPLIAFIFPCTFIVLFFPIAMKFIHDGL
jgi:tight adherence protein C